MSNFASKHADSRSEATENPCSGDHLAAGGIVVEVHLRELKQLFDSRDPLPFHEKDLHGNAEAYIVDSVKEHPTRGQCALVLHVDQATGLPDEGRAVGDAIRAHFARCAQLLHRELRQLIRRGFISLLIGLAFLAAVFVIAQALGRQVGESAWAPLWREGSLIVGWVALWRPLEIFLYDW